VTSGGAGTSRRLFFALWPDEAQRLALEHAAAQAVRGCGGRPVPAASLHVTLAFLGSVALGRIPDLQRIARSQAEVLGGHTPIELTLERLVHWKEAQVLCALPAAESASARTLATALQEAAMACGFSPDRKPFQAHVTLARKVVHPASTPRLRGVVWRFDRYSLLDSRTEPSGAVYSVIESYPLVAVEKAHD
jgi:RNA 2',3'-cyclic 3'-phosphodiesterase